MDVNWLRFGLGLGLGRIRSGSMGDGHSQAREAWPETLLI